MSLQVPTWAMSTDISPTCPSLRVKLGRSKFREMREHRIHLSGELSWNSVSVHTRRFACEIFGRSHGVTGFNIREANSQIDAVVKKRLDWNRCVSRHLNIRVESEERRPIRDGYDNSTEEQ